jgi:hypothetical protein
MFLPRNINILFRQACSLKTSSETNNSVKLVDASEASLPPESSFG